MIAQIQMRRGTTAEWAAASPVVLAAGEMGLDTTIQKSKIGDGTTEWASLPWLNGDVTNPNILHNSDFRNPVNQRGVSGTISSAGYFYDRWLLNSGSVTVAAGYLTMASGAVIEQRIEGLDLAGETVTVSVKVGTSYISGSGTFPTSAGTASVTLTGFGTATLGYNANYMFIRFTTDAARNLAACKCELGTVSTLAYDPPMDFGAELWKCQRFYARCNGNQQTYYMIETATKTHYYKVYWPRPFRITPTVVSSNWSTIVGVDWYTPSVVSFTAFHNYCVVVTGGGYTSNPMFVDFEVVLSADL